MGAKEKSYHAVSGGFAVYNNEIGAVKQTGVLIPGKHLGGMSSLTDQTIHLWQI